MKNVGAAFLQIFNKIAKYDKTLRIHRNGVDNNYPDFVESIIAESVTASTCVDRMAAYIIGKGFGPDANKIIVHPEKETTLLAFGQGVAESIAEHRGFYIHVNYNGNFEIKDMDVLPFSDCRVGKKDDNAYNGKILVCSDWGDKKKVKSAKVVDVYNPDKKVIGAQVTKSKGIEKYNGQILYFKFSKYTYPRSPLHPALKDAESEAQVSIYKNISLKKGFFGKTIVITKPLVDAEMEDENYQEQITQRNNFRDTIKKFIGAENADGVLHLELEFNGDEIEKEIIFKNIDSNINDKLFAHTENSVSENICIAYGIPPQLVKPKDGAMFSQSGEMLTQMKLYYQDQTSDIRQIVEETINKLMSRFHEKKEGLTIIPLVAIPKPEPDVN